jgi:O-antigen/teichoic acid export membrane protein
MDAQRATRVPTVNDAGVAAMTVTGRSPFSGRRIAGSAGLSLVGQLIRIFGMFILLIVLARGMAPEEYGSAVTFLVLVNLGAVLSRLGLGRAGTYLIAGRTKAASRTANSLTRRIFAVAVGNAVVQLPLWALAAVPPLTGHVFNMRGLAQLSFLIAATIVLEGLQLTLSELSRAHHRPLAAMVLGYASRAAVLLVGSTALLVVDKLTLNSFALLYLGCSTALAGLSGMYIWRLSATCCGHEAPQEIAPSWNKILVLGVPFLVNEFTGLFLTTGDTLIVAGFVDAQATAEYNAAARIANLIRLPYFALLIALPPVVAGLWAQGRTRRLEELARVSAFVSTVPVLAAAIVVAIFGEQILLLLFGDSYGSARSILWVLLIVPVINAATGSAALVLAMAGRHRLLMLSTGVGTCLITLLEVLAALRWGPIGVAGAMAVGSVLLNVCLTLMVHRVLGINTALRPVGLRDLRRIVRGLQKR